MTPFASMYGRRYPYARGSRIESRRRPPARIEPGPIAMTGPAVPLYDLEMDVVGIMLDFSDHATWMTDPWRYCDPPALVGPVVLFPRSEAAIARYRRARRLGRENLRDARRHLGDVAHLLRHPFAENLHESDEW